MDTDKRIFACHDDRGVIVYQAFRTETVRVAARKGTFGAGFGLDRMTWIKPSFGWMLHRSEYATRHRQEAIARIRLTHEGFLCILRQSIPTAFDPALFRTEYEWKTALDRSDVRYQWDPDRDLSGRKLERRAIQLGICGETVRRYVNEWILGVEDVTPLAHAVRDAVPGGRAPLPPVPNETDYPLPPDLARRLGYAPE